MRRLILLTVALVAACLVLVAKPADGATQQFTWYDQQVTHTTSSYAQPTQSASTPYSWTSPHDYANGRIYTRFQVLSKPSTKLVEVQICVWRNRFSEETCSRRPTFSKTGVYWFDFGTPTTWWKKDGRFSWSIPFEPTRFMIKDPSTGKLLMTSSCGTHCSTSSAVAGHIPMTFDVASVVVAKGATLSPPSDWQGCPSAWSPACSGTSSSSSTTTTTTSPASTTTTPPTTTPPTTTTTTTIQPGSGTVVLITGNAAALPPGDVPIRNRLLALGKQVVLVDDDGLTTGSLAGAQLAVLSSSIVPSKTPSWLATHPIPLLNAEAFAQTRLRMASSNTELASRTALRIVNSSHVLAAGRTGDVGVQTSAPISYATPAKGAAVIARLPGATSASLYAFETGAALTSGTAPARRVALFFSYDTPPRLTASGWALFDAAVTWLD